MIRLTRAPVFHAALAASVISVSTFACSTTSSPGDPVVSTCAPPDATVDPDQPSGPTASCTNPGEPTPGPTDHHCQADGGLITQVVTESACCSPGDAGGPGACSYGATMHGTEGDDDDCKYHVAWTSGPLCEGTGGVQLTVVATSLTTPGPVTGAHVRMEVFTTTPGYPGDASCDDQSTHESPFPFTDYMSEGPPGTYTGRTVFDAPGQWTVRFHLNENCLDVRADSPHGHAAFQVTVP